MQTLTIWKRLCDTTNRLSFLLFYVVLLVGVGCVTCAEAMSPPAQSSNPSTAASTGWNAAGPSSGVVTVLGAIRQVVSTGGPGGVHILIDGPLGSFDANLGSYLPNEILEALSNGVSVQATGVVRSAGGKDYLFVRQLSVAGHQVTVRNFNGFLVHHSSAPSSGSNKLSGEGNGGVQ